ncbi:MAG: dTDP-4-dehydrorhamnose reductase [Pseudomonadota bacterium]
MRIAVTGRHGQVVQSLLERARDAGVEIFTVGRPEVDLANRTGIQAALSAIKPDIVVSAAAYTAVDLAESEKEIARTVNCLGAGAVAHAAHKLGVPVVHLSTDYVFDGKLNRPYRESDITSPASIYGQTKLDGEHAVAQANDNHVILRTAWVYSPFGKNFARTMLKLASIRDEVSVVSDQRGTPTNALDIADTVIAVSRRLHAQPDDDELRGIFHMASAGEADWAEFAEAIFEASYAVGGPSASVRRIPTSAYPTPAKRPANSRLDTGKLATFYNIQLPHWRDTLPSTVTRLIAQEFQKKVSS